MEDLKIFEDVSLECDEKGTEVYRGGSSHGTVGLLDVEPGASIPFDGYASAPADELDARIRAAKATLGSELQGAGIDFDPTKYQFGFYGVIIVLMMLFRPTGLIPERRHKREMELGVADTPLYDVTTEGADTDRNPDND